MKSQVQEIKEVVKVIRKNIDHLDDYASKMDLYAHHMPEEDAIEHIKRLKLLAFMLGEIGKDL